MTVPAPSSAVSSRSPESQFHLLFEDSIEARFICDQSGILDANAAAVRLLGCRDKEELFSLRCSEISPEVQPNGRLSEEMRHEAIGLAQKQGSHRFEWVHRRRDGSDFPVEVTITAMELERRAVLIIGWRDLSEIRQAQAQVRFQQGLLDGVLQSAIDGIAVYTAVRDAAGRICDFELVLANAAAERLLGASSPELVGTRLLERHPLARADGVYARYAEIVETGRPADFEVRSPFAGGEGWLRIAGAKLGDGVAVTFSDITPRKRSESELREAKDKAEAADRAKSDFLAMMSHELRTPMNGVIGFCDLLRETRIDAVQCDYLDTIRRSGQDLLRLIDDILDFSKIEAGKLELEDRPFAVGECVRAGVDSLVPLARSKGLALGWEVDSAVPAWLRGDPTRVGQVLANLLANAVKFTDRGEVRVTVRLSAVSGRPSVAFAVRDTGIGMEPDEVGRLFRPFTQADATPTRRFGGTGLGLAICHRLVEMMGGTIEVESERGKGSRFVFHLPCRPAEPVAPATAPDRGEDRGFASRHPLRIVVAEDNPVNMRLTLLMLKRLGYEALSSTNGKECLAVLERTACDVILMDIQMPEMDGIECTRAIRAAQKPVYVIAVTADAVGGTRARCVEAGMNDYLSKPLGVPALQQALRLAASNIGRR